MGISGDTRRYIDGSVSIPMSPGVESLNAGVSASIILYSLFKKKT
jgi:tRNA G18 (ribose-2'-O)-methylase SpoU